MFKDNDHAGDLQIKKWLLGMCEHHPYAVVFKKESTVEVSVFGNEFVAMKWGIDALRGLRCKLRMIGIPTSGPSYIYGDNMSVVHNISIIELGLRRKQLILLSCSL